MNWAVFMNINVKQEILELVISNNGMKGVQIAADIIPHMLSKYGYATDFTPTILTEMVNSGELIEIEYNIQQNMPDRLRSFYLPGDSQVKVLQNFKIPEEVDLPHIQEKLNSLWKDDCCGKRDFDIPIVEFCSRTYPEGGSHLSIKVQSGSIVEQTNPGEHAELASAHVTLYSGVIGNADFYSIENILATLERSEITDVQAKDFVQKRYIELATKIVSILKLYF